MKTIVLFFILIFSLPVLAFEGIIHCTKIQNGVVTNFDFYIKNNRIALVSQDEGGSFYKLLINPERTTATICIDHPAYEKKGYYLVTREDKSHSVTVFNKQQLKDIEIDGQACAGYVISTDIGSAIAYMGTEEIDLTGLSVFFQDPVYELLDAFQLKTLPKKLVVSKNTGDYSIQMTVEAVPVDAAVFEIPEGYEQFSVQLSDH